MNYIIQWFFRKHVLNSVSDQYYHHFFLRTNRKKFLDKLNKIDMIRTSFFIYMLQVKTLTNDLETTDKHTFQIC